MTLRFDLKLVPDEDLNANGFWITADVPMGFDLFDLVPLPDHHVMAVREAYDPRDGGPMHLMNNPLSPAPYQFDASWLRAMNKSREREVQVHERRQEWIDQLYGSLTHEHADA